MPKKTYSYRMDEATKQKFDEVCEVLGVNSSTAINMFAAQVIQRREIPFNIRDAKENSTQGDKQ